MGLAGQTRIHSEFKNLMRNKIFFSPLTLPHKTCGTVDID